MGSSRSVECLQCSTTLKGGQGENLQQGLKTVVRGEGDKSNGLGDYWMKDQDCAVDAGGFDGDAQHSQYFFGAAGSAFARR
jgi:hypothetical protein